jgi:hypothetical protein
MTVAQRTPESAKQMSLEDHRVKVRELEQIIRELNESLDASRAELAGNKSDRATLILPARVRKDKLAQSSSLQEIDKQAIALRQTIEDDEAALRQVAERLAIERNAVTLGEWEEERNQIRKQLVALQGGEAYARVQRAVDELEASLKAAIEEEDRIGALLVAFEPSLHSLRGQLTYVRRSRAEILRFALHEPLEINPGRQTTAQRESIGGREQRAFEAAIESLDRLELVF